ncbi:MAG: hypothetical protein HPY66_0751 [Firmicutes bacterium]|nr:hypothetical protein [Bacillota bacterium]
MFVLNISLTVCRQTQFPRQEGTVFVCKLIPGFKTLVSG